MTGFNIYLNTIHLIPGVILKLIENLVEYLGFNKPNLIETWYSSGQVFI